ncbi:hypothetical protein PAPYR_12816 [Paratrimastix pyriformis]|uniref:Uncharacterized protein n=1 Tax=Paratrimastix pyriformis TaxID=342808 RepID=A0ABQ8U4V2_9EUKA|nr:hypothetical protein PAPYR_12816 [Paratrimastix pyriformis]
MMKNPAVAAAIGQQPAGPSFIVRGIADAEGMYSPEEPFPSLEEAIEAARECSSAFQNDIYRVYANGQATEHLYRHGELFTGVVFLVTKENKSGSRRAGKIHDSEPEARADLDGPNPENFFDGCIHRVDGHTMSMVGYKPLPREPGAEKEDEEDS